jgi:hypothetical protein
MNDGHADQRTFVGEPGPAKGCQLADPQSPPVSPLGRRVTPSRHREQRAADAAGVKLDIKSGRHYTASQLLVGGFDLRNTAQG